MALTEKDLLASIAKLKEKNAQQQAPVERMSMSEFKQIHGINATSADVVSEKSTQVLEEQQEQVIKAVSDKNSDGLYKESVEQTEAAQKSAEYQKEQLDAILKLGKSFESVKSPLEKLADKLQAYSPSNIKETLLTKMNIKIPGVGGIFDKAIAKERFIKTEKLLGSTKTKSEISRDFKSYNEQSKIIQKNSTTINKIKAALPDASEEQLMRVPEYAKAKQESEVAAKESGKFTVKSALMSPTNEDVGSTTKQKPSKRQPQSAGAIVPDNIKAATSSQTRTPQTKAVESVTPPKLGFVDKVQKIGGGMVGAAKGVAAMGASLLALTLGIKAISTVDFESIAKATVALGGVVVVSKLIGSASGSMLKGALGIAAIGGALMLASKGFESFAELDWEALAKAGVALGGLALAAAGIGAFVAPILVGAAAIAAIGGSVMVLASGIEALSNAMDKFKSPKVVNKPVVSGETTPTQTDNIQPQTSSSPKGTKEAYEQTYNKHISEGRAPFAAKMLADKEHGMTGTGLSASALPSVSKAQPFSANAVYNASAENAESAAASNAGTTNNVVAPTTVNNTNNQVGGYKPDVRNQDSSFKRMLDSRYVPV